jgi:hypothetical protein
MAQLAASPNGLQLGHGCQPLPVAGVLGDSAAGQNQRARGNDIQHVVAFYNQAHN